MLQHPKDGVLRKKKGLNEYLDLFFAYVRKKYYLCAKFDVMCMKIREVSAKIWVIVSLVLLMVACKPAPQQVRRLGEEKVDSLMLMQMEFNNQMTAAADRVCLEYVQKDSTIRYAQDDFGYWYAKTITTYGECLKTGQNIMLHLQVSELNGELIADVKQQMSVDSGDLPLAINQVLKMMREGEQMIVVAPWYTAYGVEGTKLVKPYANLKIVVEVER